MRHLVDVNVYQRRGRAPPADDAPEFDETCGKALGESYVSYIFGKGMRDKWRPTGLWFKHLSEVATDLWMVDLLLTKKVFTDSSRIFLAGSARRFP